MRRNEVTLSYDSAERSDDIMSKGRAERLALFLSTIQESPGAFLAIIGAHTAVADILAASRKESISNYGEHLDAVDEFSYGNRVLYVTGMVLRHDDDVAATPDPETVSALHRARTLRIREEATDTEWRIQRLGIIAQQVADTLTEVNPPIISEGTDTEVA